MGDTIKKWHEMVEDGDITPNAGHFGNNASELVRKIERTKYIFLLDFNDGKVYKYDISVLCRKENEWNPDTESCETFLELAGHSVNDCEWMVTTNGNIEYGN
tara:strand:+ start:1457 stop:1762 length:306 start_codon:yes stop_codon:yes gene_type:complete